MENRYWSRIVRTCIPRNLIFIGRKDKEKRKLQKWAIDKAVTRLKVLYQGVEVVEFFHIFRHDMYYASCIIYHVFNTFNLIIIFHSCDSEMLLCKNYTVIICGNFIIVKQILNDEATFIRKKYARKI